MFSDFIKSALEAEVAGQPRAIASLVQGVTRAVSGLVPPEGPLCAYMFMGPSGTGKTHLVQTLARTLHGDPRRLIVADCTHFIHGDPWLAFVSQLAPLFTSRHGPAPWGSSECPLLSPPGDSRKWAVAECPPLSIILVEYLERGRAEVVKSLAVALETGRVMLPEGRQGSLRNCIIVLTSGLCSREIFEEGHRIGFSGSNEEDELGKLFKLCNVEAQKHYGTDLMARLDDFIIFHRLREDHLSEILSRLVRNLNRWLRGRGLRCELTAAARDFLLDRGLRHLQMGARELLRAHRRFLEFPLGDLTISGGVPPGGLVIVDRRPEEKGLHFTVTNSEHAAHSAGSHSSQEVQIAWEDEDVSRIAAPCRIA